MFQFGSSSNALPIVGNQKYFLNESLGKTRLRHNIFYGLRTKMAGGIFRHWHINAIYLLELLSSVYSLMPTQSLLSFNFREKTSRVLRF